jgi:hypothetical protein
MNHCIRIKSNIFTCVASSVRSSGVWRRVVWQNDVMPTFTELQRLVPVCHSSHIPVDSILKNLRQENLRHHNYGFFFQSLFLRACVKHKIFLHHSYHAVKIRKPTIHRTTVYLIILNPINAISQMSWKLYLKYSTENTAVFCLASNNAKNSQYLIFRYTKCNGCSSGSIINYDKNSQ